MRLRSGPKRWLVASLGLAAFVACSDEDEQTDEGMLGGAAGEGADADGSAPKGGTSGAPASGGRASGGRSSTGGSSSGGDVSTGGDSSSGGGGGAGTAGAEGAAGAPSVCGDGETDGDEICDDGFEDDCGSCDATCSGVGSGSLCGDAEFCEEEELGVCDCRARPVHGVLDGIIRFVALGDGGEGNATQYAVARGVAAVCERRGGCDFALYLGDNIYPVGASSATDAAFETKFELPYCELGFPFYVVLGNHDYGNGSVLDEGKADAQIAYSALSAKWRLPGHNYTRSFAEGASRLDVFALDTTRLQFGADNAAQASWFDSVVADSTATWKIAVGHHTYVSNGSHGNAGNYEGLPLVPIVNGADIETFFDENVCGAVDLYLSGHDHSRQWLEASCGLEVVVSGTAAKTTALVGRDDNTTYFQDNAGGGFALFEIHGDTLRGWFYGQGGNPKFMRTMTK